MSSDGKGSNAVSSASTAAASANGQASDSSSMTATDRDQVRANLGGRPVDSGSSRPAPPYRAPFFPSGAQPEIIRANQKDLYYLAQLSDQIEEVARAFLGTRWVQHFAAEIGIASQLAYYGLTTLLGSQTLGEEYVDILQYDARTRKLPTPWRRASLVASHVLAPYFLAKAYTRLKRHLSNLRTQQSSAAPSAVDRIALSVPDPLFADEQDHNDEKSSAAPTSSTLPSSRPPAASYLPLTSLITNLELPTFESLLDEHVRAVHLAVFYLFGRYYHLAKRLVRVRYLSLQGRIGPGQASPPSYEVLGVLMVVQLAVRLLSAAARRRKAAREAANALLPPQQVQLFDEKQDLEYLPKRQIATVDGQPVTELVFDPEDPTPVEEAEAEAEAHSGEGTLADARKCTLCLGPRRDPAATECGHVFCYTCIVGWVREKAECPLCRQKVNISRILPLYNI